MFISLQTAVSVRIVHCNFIDFNTAQCSLLSRICITIQQSIDFKCLSSAQMLVYASVQRPYIGSPTFMQCNWQFSVPFYLFVFLFIVLLHTIRCAVGSSEIDSSTSGKHPHQLHLKSLEKRTQNRYLSGISQLTAF